MAKSPAPRFTAPDAESRPPAPSNPTTSQSLQASFPSTPISQLLTRPDLFPIQSLPAQRSLTWTPQILHHHLERRRLTTEGSITYDPVLTAAVVQVSGVDAEVPCIRCQSGEGEWLGCVIPPVQHGLKTWWACANCHRDGKTGQCELYLQTEQLNRLKKPVLARMDEQFQQRTEAKAAGQPRAKAPPKKAARGSVSVQQPPHQVPQKPQQVSQQLPQQLPQQLSQQLPQHPQQLQQFQQPQQAHGTIYAAMPPALLPQASVPRPQAPNPPVGAGQVGAGPPTLRPPQTITLFNTNPETTTASDKGPPAKKPRKRAPPRKKATATNDQAPVAPASLPASFPMPVPARPVSNGPGAAIQTQHPGSAVPTPSTGISTTPVIQAAAPSPIANAVPLPSLNAGYDNTVTIRVESIAQAAETHKTDAIQTVQTDNVQTHPVQSQPVGQAPPRVQLPDNPELANETYRCQTLSDFIAPKIERTSVPLASIAPKPASPVPEVIDLAMEDFINFSPVFSPVVATAPAQPSLQPTPQVEQALEVPEVDISMRPGNNLPNPLPLYPHDPMAGTWPEIPYEEVMTNRILGQLLDEPLMSMEELDRELEGWYD